MYEAMAIQSGMTAIQKTNITQTINAYSKRLLGFIRKRVKNEEDAEDILQDVFFQFVGNSQPIEQVTAWLFTVARNKIIDKKRKHKTESLEDVFYAKEGDLAFDWTDIFSEEAENPETDYLRSLFWEELNAALAELPEEQRTVFVQNELDGTSFNDISEQTGVSVNTLLSRKRYAVLHLRQRLAVLKDELLNY
jgi:RNA polymerase sigma factor (sigma-70 family)